MTDRQSPLSAVTCSLLVYGSLMERWELVRTGLTFERAVPVTASGFRREFTQEPSWRSREGIERGVLTVRRAPGSLINAVLVTGIPLAGFAVLDQRERGYRRRVVSPERLTPFELDTGIADTCFELDQVIFSYEGRTELSNPALRPNAEYLAICLQAAAAWGEPFRRMFLQTTIVAGNALHS